MLSQAERQLLKKLISMKNDKEYWTLVRENQYSLHNLAGVGIVKLGYEVDLETGEVHETAAPTDLWKAAPRSGWLVRPILGPSDAYLVQPHRSRWGFCLFGDKNLTN